MESLQGFVNLKLLSSCSSLSLEAAGEALSPRLIGGQQLYKVESVRVFSYSMQKIGLIYCAWH